MTGESLTHAGFEIAETRTVAAPKDALWKAWTRPEEVALWWGPDGFTNEILEMDVRPGGHWRLVMHAPDGTAFPNTIVFDEVQAPDVLRFRNIREHTDGSVHYEADVRFTTVTGGTSVAIQLIFDSRDERDQVAAMDAVNQMLARLAASVEA